MLTIDENSESGVKLQVRKKIRILRLAGDMVIVAETENKF